MTTYTAITNGEIDQDSPVTQPLLTALRDNPIAITEEASGAPKIKRSFDASSSITGTQVFTGLDDYGGIEFHIVAEEGAGTSNEPVYFAFSDDSGSTWSTNHQIGTVYEPSSKGFGYGFFDFATGDLISVFSGSGGNTLVNTTLSGASAAIDQVRFISDNLAVIIKKTGGKP